MKQMSTRPEAGIEGSLRVRRAAGLVQVGTAFSASLISSESLRSLQKSAVFPHLLTNEEAETQGCEVACH